MNRRFSLSIRVLLLLFCCTFPLPLIAQEARSIASGPIEVEVGMYVIDLAKLDMKENEFYADFYIWYKWANSSDTTWSPENIEFMNGTILNATKLASEAMTDGRFYASQRVKATFRGRFNLQMYPFDSQTLPIVLEDSELVRERMTFIVDGSQGRPETWLETSVQIPDWRIDGVQAFVDLHHYDTAFGLGAQPQNARQTYSRFSFTVRLQRFFIPHLIKFIIPLLVIAGMAYLVFWINAKEFEAQTGICVTALLSAVALHNSQADALPAVGYLVMADKVFILFYIVIYMALVQTVAVNTFAKRSFIKTAARIDRLFQWLYPITLIVGCLLIVLSSWVFS